MRFAAARLALAAVASVAVLGSACGGSGYQYVKNDDLGLYARMPDDWTVYDEADLYPDASETMAEVRAQRLWVRTFDSSGEEGGESTATLSGPSPAGFVRLQHLSEDEQEGLALRALQQPLFATQVAPQDVQLIDDEMVEFEGGYSGVHRVFLVDDPSGPYVVDQTAVRDSLSSAVLTLLVGCSERCYFETHKDEIADVVDSLTIQEVSA